jgi:hypothetical protein
MKCQVRTTINSVNFVSMSLSMYGTDQSGTVQLRKRKPSVYSFWKSNYKEVIRILIIRKMLSETELQWPLQRKWITESCYKYTAVIYFII